MYPLTHFDVAAREIPTSTAACVIRRVRQRSISDGRLRTRDALIRVRGEPLLERLRPELLQRNGERSVRLHDKPRQRGDVESIEIIRNLPARSSREVVVQLSAFFTPR